MGCTCSKSDVVVKSGKLKGIPIIKREVELSEEKLKKVHHIDHSKNSRESRHSPSRIDNNILGQSLNIRSNRERLNNNREFQLIENHANLYRDTDLNVLPYLSSNSDPNFNFHEIGKF
jgi:hypothetical protein